MLFLERFIRPRNIIIAFTLINLIIFAYFVTAREYPPLIMSLHIATIVLLWLMIFQKLHLIKIIKSKYKELLIIFLLFIVAFMIRIFQVEDITPGMYGDELTVAVFSLGLLEYPEWIPYDGTYPHYYFHPTPLMYMTAHSINIIGHTLTAIRFPSILFGAFSIVAFYIFLRLFFNPVIAVLGSSLMVFQYTHIVLSRLAYEPIPSLFFQILTLIFVFLYIKNKNIFYLAGTALSLGGGLYTYLNFRPFAAVMFLVVLVLIFYLGRKNFIKSAGLFCIIFLISVMPLIASWTIDPAGFWGRTSEISIFNRNYTAEEFGKEIWGNFSRTIIYTFFQFPNPDPDAPPASGDPNPGKNPAGAPVFDIVTMMAAVFGLIYLFIYKRKLFLLMAILFIPPIISDIFSSEVIPDFHYYGLGHPNALRVSGFILLILFAATAAMHWAYVKWEMKVKAEMVTLLVIPLILVCFWNWHLYFNQKDIQPNFYLYNYKFNHGKTIYAGKYLSGTGNKSIGISDSLENGFINYLTSYRKSVKVFRLNEDSDLVAAIRKNDAVVVSITDKSQGLIEGLVAGGYSTDELRDIKLKSTFIKNPLGGVELVIFEKI